MKNKLIWHDEVYKATQYNEQVSWTYCGTFKIRIPYRMKYKPSFELLKSKEGNISPIHHIGYFSTLKKAKQIAQYLTNQEDHSKPVLIKPVIHLFESDWSNITEGHGLPK